MKIALVGIGEIAKQQHVPTINMSDDWELAATCSREGKVPGIDAYTDFALMLKERPDIEVISLCLPPKPRLHYAIAALKDNRHVMLEKPPAAALSECHMLLQLAQRKQRSLFATWHSREADAVAFAKNWMVGKTLKRLEINWLEDVRRWHAGQEWIWQPGGFGVFDPGINALSIVTHILPDPIWLSSARLEVPQNKQTPIAAGLVFAHPNNAEVSAKFDWREQGEQVWQIDIETDNGSLQLLNGGSQCFVDGVKIENTDDYQTLSSDAATDTLRNEYRRLYQQMRNLISKNKIDMDLRPLKLVTDAYALGERISVAPFHD